MKHPKYYETDAATSKRMSNVKLKKGKAETLLAKQLWNKGYRCRLNYKKLPGSPDIVLTKFKISIFVDGEFWHGYNWNEKKSKLKRNKEYWIEKIEENIERDKRVDQELKMMEWIPIHFWTKEIDKNLDECLTVIDEVIFEQSTGIEM